jgi:hypothetical protein
VILEISKKIPPSRFLPCRWGKTWKEQEGTKTLSKSKSLKMAKKVIEKKEEAKRR